MNSTRFRMLICAEIALAICLFVLGYCNDPFLPKELQQSYSYHISEAALSIYYWLVLPQLVLIVLCWVLIWRFWRFSRELYLAVMLLGWFSHLIVRHDTLSGISLMLTLAAGFLSGAILCAAYFSPISSYFKMPNNAIHRMATRVTPDADSLRSFGISRARGSHHDSTKNE